MLKRDRDAINVIAERIQSLPLTIRTASRGFRFR
jgi:hypothetical protein